VNYSGREPRANVARGGQTNRKTALPTKEMTMNATTNRLDNQHTPGFSEVTGDEMKQVEGGDKAGMLGKNPDSFLLNFVKELKKVLTCGGPNGQL
jgi:hypothetical protein